MNKEYINVDANTAVSNIAYYLSEIAEIYPITPSSAMAENCDELKTKGKKNIFGNELMIKEMQSEAGAVGALHGSLSGGALATTFTASQGLLLMIPNMFKIAGELLPTVFHVSARSVATHALSIFGDHSDVMSVRQTGFCMLCSNSVQEAQDFALISHIASLKSSLPFLHFFDGFRTSHEVQKIEKINEENIKSIFPFDKVNEFRNRALNPNNPTQKGTAQNPDIFFQNREASNTYYDNVYKIVEQTMKDVTKITGRSYKPFEYFGDKNAEFVIVLMGSGTETAEETIKHLNQNGEKYGLIKIHLYRPFNSKEFVKLIPNTCKKIAVLDRTKESGSVGEPLFVDVSSSIQIFGKSIQVIGGRYGIGGKEFTPNCVKAVFDNLKKEKPKTNFTVGIDDDITHLSLKLPYFELPNNMTELKFYGLGSDGTVSANKNSIKIIGEETNYFTQGFFEYDSKKSGSITISHLRFSKQKIKAPYVVTNPSFIAIHNYSFLARYDLISNLKQNGTVLLNTVLKEEELSQKLPKRFVDVLKEKNAKFYIIDAEDIALNSGLKNKINTVMQSAFFKLTKLLDEKTIKEKLKNAAIKSYGHKGQNVIDANISAIEQGFENVKKIDINKLVGKVYSESKSSNNEYYEKYIKPINALEGNKLPVSAFTADGSVPTNTTKLEKRGIASEFPEWKCENCIQCGQCVLACPHSAIRANLVNKDNLKNKPNSFETKPALGVKDAEYRIQVSPLDCTGCGVCAKVCPAKQKALIMQSMANHLDTEKDNFNYSMSLKQENSPFSTDIAKGLQFKKPYFEYSYACAGCGETPYIKLLSTLFGDKMIIANATGCSSIYGGSSPACPFAKDEKGKGPAWANSLFEDNAEFGLGIKLARLAQGDTNSSVWIIGGDGWAYDIGYGGLDHILASGENVNILVLDTEVYSNTGGQSSKSTPTGAFAKFASSGKTTSKKDLGQIAMTYPNVYVASISLGADSTQAIKAFKEAEAFDGPSIIIAYSPCINHGIDMSGSNYEMKKAVESGYWFLYRRNPKNEKPFTLDSKEPNRSYEDFLLGETRYSALNKTNPENAKKLFEKSKQDALQRYNKLKKLDENN